MKSIASALLFIILFVSTSFSQPTISSVTDDFSGGDELPITTNWTGGISGTGDCNRDNDRLENRSGAGDESCYYDISTFGQRQEMFFTIPNASSWSLDVTARVHMCIIGGVGTANFDGYGLLIRPITGANNDRIQLFRTQDNGHTSVGTAYESRDFADNDKYAVVIDGSNFGTEVTFEVFLDSGGGWTSIITHTEDTGDPVLHDCSNSHVGFELVNTSHAVDDFGVGNTIDAQNLLMQPVIFFN